MSQRKILATDREFFAVLADVVYGNPFSLQRADLVSRLAPGATVADQISDREALARVVAPRLAPYLRAGTPDTASLGEERPAHAGAGVPLPLLPARGT